MRRANAPQSRRGHGPTRSGGFLNRIDDIVVLHPLGMAEVERVVGVWFADVRERLACERMTLRIATAANWIYVRRHVLTLACFLRR